MKSIRIALGVTLKNLDLIISKIQRIDPEKVTLDDYNEICKIIDYLAEIKQITKTSKTKSVITYLQKFFDNIQKSILTN